MSIEHGVITLNVLSPVYIGSGSSLNKKEYFRNNQEGRIYVLDTKKFFAFLLKKNLQNSYQEFMLNPKTRDLNQWLQEHRNQISYKDIMGFCGYSMDIGDVEIGKTAILTFMKDSYGNPYIPGSSLKGAIRTTLLYAITKRKGVPRSKLDELTNEVFSSDRLQRRRFLSSTANYIDSKLERKLGIKDNKGKDIVEKQMSGFRISDSKPLDKETLTVCHQIEYQADGNQHKLNNIRECLKPGTKISFNYTIDTQVFPYSTQDVKQMITLAFQYYQSDFLRSFPHKREYPECSLCLGGSVGFVSKTLIYGLYDKKNAIKVTRKILDKQFYKHKHKNDTHISPRIRKMTYYRGTLYDMGICEVTLHS